MKAFGVESEVEEDGLFEVFEENWEAAELFLDLSTQWQSGAMGGLIGLRYEAVEAVMRIRKTKNRKRVFEDVQTMEFAALAFIDKKASAK